MESLGAVFHAAIAYGEVLLIMVEAAIVALLAMVTVDGEWSEKRFESQKKGARGRKNVYWSSMAC